MGTHVTWDGGSKGVPSLSARVVVQWNAVVGGAVAFLQRSKLMVGVNSDRAGFATKLSCTALLKSFRIGKPPEIPVTRCGTDPVPGSATVPTG